MKARRTPPLLFWMERRTSKLRMFVVPSQIGVTCQFWNADAQESVFPSADAQESVLRNSDAQEAVFRNTDAQKSVLKVPTLKN